MDELPVRVACLTTGDAVTELEGESTVEEAADVDPDGDAIADSEADAIVDSDGDGLVHPERDRLGGEVDHAFEPDAGSREPEQDAAYRWCRSAVTAAEVVTLEAIAEGCVDLEAYDALWWHRTRPIDPVRSAAEAAAEPIGEYLQAGGGLLLSIRALAAVDALGIDSVPPDATGTERIDHPTGFAIKHVYEDHPAFEGFVDRFYTLPQGEGWPYARYETIVPEDGHVLASAVHADDLLPAHREVVEWSVGAGRVIGVGGRIDFLDRTAGGFDRERNRFVRNLLATVGTAGPVAFTDRPTDAAGFRRLRSALSTDHHRPAVHVSPPANWLNDPNGIIHHDGTYHLFYQYNPSGPFHASIHWGHATSEDLLSWRDRPVALAPDPDGPDRGGCWSGCAVVDRDRTSDGNEGRPTRTSDEEQGRPTIVYTGGRGREQLPCLATAIDDSMESFRKHPDNPIIETPPTDPELLSTEDWAAEFRDHSLFRDDDAWYHLIGCGLEGGGGAVLLYRGEELDEWEYIGPLLSSDRSTDRAVWECPELLDFGDRQLLHVSNYETVRYFVGEVDLSEPGFEIHREGVLDRGSFYAPQSTETPDGRILTWGWVLEDRGLDAQWRAGWSGALSLPRELEVDVEGQLRQRPARELTGLRDRRVHSGSIRMAAGDRIRLERPSDRIGSSGEQIDPRDDPEAPDRTGAYEFDLELTLDGEEAAFELGVFESPALSERTTIEYDGTELRVDRSASTHDPTPEIGTVRLPLEGNALSLRAFVDGSIVELFANDRHCLTTRVYPTRTDAIGSSIAAKGGPVTVESIEAWELSSIWR